MTSPQSLQVNWYVGIVILSCLSSGIGGIEPPHVFDPDDVAPRHPFLVGNGRKTNQDSYAGLAPN